MHPPQDIYDWLVIGLCLILFALAVAKAIRSTGEPPPEDERSRR